MGVRLRWFEHLGVRDVDVPAGSFSAAGVQRLNPESGEHATFWLVREFGVVKVSGKTEVLSDGPEKRVVLFEWTLKKFEQSKK